MKKKFAVAFGIMLVLIAAVASSILIATNDKKTKDKDKKILNESDIWEELGIEPYDSEIPVVYASEEYISASKYSVTLKKDMLPKEPFCLVIPEDVSPLVDIESEFLVDFICLSSDTPAPHDCPMLKRIVYACKGELAPASGYACDLFPDVDIAYIQGYQFCDNMEEVVFLRQDIPYVIDGIMGIKNLDIPPHTLSLRSVEGGWDIRGYECPSELKEICNSNICDNLRYIKFNEGLERLMGVCSYDINLEYAIMPQSLKEIEYSFEFCSDSLTLVVYKDTYAEKYAKENELNYIYNEDFDLEAYKAELEARDDDIITDYEWIDYITTNDKFSANRYQESYHLGKYSDSGKQTVKATGTLTDAAVKTTLMNNAETDVEGSASLSVIVYSTGYVAYQKGTKEKVLKKDESVDTGEIPRHYDNNSMYYEHQGIVGDETITINVSQLTDIVNY